MSHEKLWKVSLQNPTLRHQSSRTFGSKISSAPLKTDDDYVLVTIFLATRHVSTKRFSNEDSIAFVKVTPFRSIFSSQPLLQQ